MWKLMIWHVFTTKKNWFSLVLWLVAIPERIRLVFSHQPLNILTTKYKQTKNNTNGQKSVGLDYMYCSSDGAVSPRLRYKLICSSLTHSYLLMGSWTLWLKMSPKELGLVTLKAKFDVWLNITGSPNSPFRHSLIILTLCALPPTHPLFKFKVLGRFSSFFYKVFLEKVYEVSSYM